MGIRNEIILCGIPNEISNEIPIRILNGLLNLRPCDGLLEFVQASKYSSYQKRTIDTNNVHNTYLGQTLICIEDYANKY